ncbi:MAG: hypothetical protein V1902_00195 [Candidatus Falkowbacteria bacterium]
MSRTTSQDSGFPGWYVTFQTAALNQLPRPPELDQVTAEGWIKNQGALKKVLAEDLLPPTLKKTMAERVGGELASEILGKDFINAAEIEAAFRMKYEAEQLAMLEDSMPSEEVLRWMAANEYMLVAKPPTEMSLLDVRAEKRELFYSKTDDGWYCKQEQTFARDDKTSAGWLALRKTIVPNSQSKTWEEQQKLLTKDERVPNAAEVAWGVIAYKAVRNVFLLPTMYARTSSVSALGFHVDVGGFVVAGLDVCVWFDCYVGRLGLAGARLPTVR